MEQNSESDTSIEYEQETNTTETLQVHHGMNEITHDEENSSESEDDTPEDENVTEMQTYENNGEDKQTRRQTPNYQL